MISENLSEIYRLLENSMEFDFLESDIQSIPENYIIDWMISPFTRCIQYMRGKVRIEFKESKAYEVQAGEGVILQPGVLFRAIFLSSDMAVAWTHVNYKIMDCIDILSLFDVPAVLNKKVAGQIGDISRELTELSHSNRKTYSLPIIIRKKELTFNLFLLIVNNSKPKSNALEFLINAQRLQPVLKYVEENLNKKITVAEMAEKIFMSVPHFHATFRQIMGIAPMQYLRQQRFKIAQIRLATSNMNIAQIAESVGYENAFHFSRIFKSTFGISPQVYRRRFYQFISV